MISKGLIIPDIPSDRQAIDLRNYDVDSLD